MSKTGYRQVHNIQAKLFYSEIKFQIIEFSALAKYSDISKFFEN